MLYAFFWVNPRRLKFICRIYPNIALRLVHSTSTYLPMKMEQSVPKRRHINFRRRGFAQKKAYNIQYTAKV